MTGINGPQTHHPAWIDELVDLHILAEHGDTDAATTARHWMVADPDARHLWDSVDRTCEQLRRRSS